MGRQLSPASEALKAAYGLFRSLTGCVPGRGGEAQGRGSLGKIPHRRPSAGPPVRGCVSDRIVAAGDRRRRASHFKDSRWTTSRTGEVRPNTKEKLKQAWWKSAFRPIPGSRMTKSRPKDAASPVCTRAKSGSAGSLSLSTLGWHLFGDFLRGVAGASGRKRPLPSLTFSIHLEPNSGTSRHSGCVRLENQPVSP